MHLEARGIPMVGIMTTAFTSSVADQLQAFNFPDYQAVYIEHPVASLPPEAVHLKTDKIVDRVIEVLLGSRP